MLKNKKIYQTPFAIDNGKTWSCWNPFMYDLNFNLDSSDAITLGVGYDATRDYI